MTAEQQEWAKKQALIKFPVIDHPKNEIEMLSEIGTGIKRETWEKALLWCIENKEILLKQLL